MSRANTKLLLGLDEVGRGSFAGPVVAACVVMPATKTFKLKIKKKKTNTEFVIVDDSIMITDSKKMTARQRKIASCWITKNAISFGIGIGSVSHINNVGIVKAANFAFRSAFHACKINDIKDIEQVLIDAFYVPRLGKIKKNKQRAIVHGDALFFEIAAASIVAKVYRDNLMEKLSVKCPHYRWEQNKGYGTLFHRQAIKKYGTTKHHRTLYCRNCAV